MHMNDTFYFNPMQAAHMPYGIPVYSVPFLILLGVAILLVSGLGLWHAAKRGDKVWFIVFLFIHTAGILELIYLFGVLKLKWKDLW